MRRFVTLFVLGAAFFIVACQSQSETKPQAPPEPALRPTLTIKEIMKAVVEPSAQALWDSVATNVTDKGSENKVPQNDKEWAEVRRNGIAMVEAMNLVMMEGRHLAPPGTKSDNPGSELEPDEMEKLIGADRATFYKLAHGLQDAGPEALKAIEKKDTEALSNAGGDIDAACEACHTKYWYPNKK